MERLRLVFGHQNGEQRVRLSQAALFLLAAVLGSFLWSGGAEAASLKAINTKYHLVSDGSRFVAFQKPDGTPTVLDSRTGEVRKIRGAGGCKPASVAYGRVLVDCADHYYDEAPPSRIASAWTGKSREIRNSRKWDDYRFGELGKFWVRADCQPGPCYTTTYTNFRSGKRRVFSTVGLAPKRLPDGLGTRDYELDYRHFGRLEPHPYFSIFSRDFDWYSYIDFGRHYYLLNESDGLYVVRSPHMRVRIGGRLPYDGTTVESRLVFRGSGKLVWTKGRWLRAYDLGTGERILRKLPKVPSGLTVVKQGAVVSFSTKLREDKRTISRLRIVRF